MSKKFDYDNTDPSSIEKYSKKLINKTFEEVLYNHFEEENEEYFQLREQFNNPYKKGSLGNLIEEYHFGYKPNNSPEPDFLEAGVELKVSPYEKTKTGKIRAGERLVLGMIPNHSPIPDSFYDSIAYNNLKLLLLILYFRNRKVERIQHPIHYTQLISAESQALEKDLEIIKSDYQIIKDKIQAGLAHELSEADTMYLGAATKGATAKKSLQGQYYNPKVPAKRRAFSLKQGYMSSFINEYIIGEIQTYDEITKENVTADTFEDIVIQRLMDYRGFSREELMDKFSLKNSKDIYSRLTLKILDIHTENAKEFEKSNTQIKTIRVEEDDSIREHVSFPTFSMIEFSKETWEDSKFYEIFSETRFLFVVFKKKGGTYYLENALFWHMPASDLENKAQLEWQKAQDVVNAGIKFKVGKSNRVSNNLPKATQTDITHIRPHASLAAYLLTHNRQEVFQKGDIQKHGDQLPNGDYMTKQCFWLNKNYIEENILN